MEKAYFSLKTVGRVARNTNFESRILSDLVSIARLFEHGWDVADICLERCSKAIDRVASLTVPINRDDADSSGATFARTHSSNNDAQQQLTEQDLLDPAWLNQPYTTLDMDLPLDAFDFPWDNM